MESCGAGGEKLFAEQAEVAGKTGRRERSHRGMITEEDIGLGCKLEVGKLGQALRKAGRDLLASSTVGTEGSFHGEVWSGWKRAGKKLPRQASKGRVKKTKFSRSKKHQLLWEQPCLETQK